MSYRHSLRYSELIATAAALFVLWPSSVRAGSELERHLRDQYADKTLVLRNFYDGDRLRYDSTGTVVGGSALSGDWTVDGFVRVKSLDLHGQRLTIQAERLSLGNTGQAFQPYFDKDKKKAEKEHRLRVEVEFDAGGITAEAADAALSKVFLTAQDHLAELVPDYWRPCVLAASTGKSMERAATPNSSPNWRTLPTAGRQNDACSFPPEFAAIPGVVYSLDETQKSDDASSGEGKAPESLVGHIGKGVSPPKLVFQTNPAFSEAARSAKYQGTIVLSIVIDKTGQVRNIRILRPLGLGLDLKAVEAVSQWQFNPATKDGEPVDAEIAVEVSFHLY